jgi:hypothetical protein
MCVGHAVRLEWNLLARRTPYQQYGTALCDETCVDISTANCRKCKLSLYQTTTCEQQKCHFQSFVTLQQCTIACEISNYLCAFNTCLVLAGG